MADPLELPEQTLRQVIAGEDRLLRQVRDKLREHGEIGSYQLVGAIPQYLDNWIAIFGRQLLRLHAPQYLSRIPAEAVGRLLLPRLFDRVRAQWLRGVKPNRAVELQARAEAAMRDEFGNCSGDRSANAEGPTKNVASAGAGAPAGSRRKPGPKPQTEQHGAVLRVVKQLYGDRWRSWRDLDLCALADALDAAGIPVPKPWRTRPPQRRDWTDGLTHTPEEFRKAIEYRVETAMRAGN